MPADVNLKATGKNAVVSWAGTIYDCLTDIAVNGSAEEVTEECSTDGTGNPESFSETAAPKYTASVTLKLPAEDPTVPTAFLVGTSGALKVYLAGDEQFRWSYDWATARINSHGAASSIRQFGGLDVQWVCTGPPTVSANDV